jgi:cation transport protein ChaC
MTATTPWPKLPRPGMDEKESRALLQETMAKAPDPADIWIFGFGSLIWNPGFEPAVRRPATLEGYLRRFHIWTTMARGTPERPGLGMCLEPAQGRCRGIAFRLAPETRDKDLEYLWSREMISGVYAPTWVHVQADGGGDIPALTWAANPGHVQYAGPRPVEEMAEIMAGGCGKFGTCRDYLANTIAEMAKLGDCDPSLDRLLALIDARVSSAGEP